MRDFTWKADDFGWFINRIQIGFEKFGLSSLASTVKTFKSYEETTIEDVVHEFEAVEH